MTPMETEELETGAESTESTTETTETASETAENQGKGASEGSESTETEASKAEKAIKDAEEAGEKEAKEAAEAAGKGASEGDEEGEKPAAFKPNVKFKVMDKEYEIAKPFQSIMKDAASEKLVRELHEKAYGLDVIKPKLQEVREERNKFHKENTELHGGINELRTIYQGAVKSGNLLKLDRFFDRLQIPHDVVLQYALSKVQLSELPPEQKNAVLAQQDAEQRAEALEKSQADTQAQMHAMTAQNMRIMLDQGLARPEVKSAADAFDERVGKPGAFEQEVIKAGKMAFFESEGKVVLSPEQAIKQVIQQYGLTEANAASATTTPVASAAGVQVPGKKAPVQRTTATIPNVAGRTASPLKQKPRSVEDIKELAKRAAAGEAV